jgi:hypothetical protein
LVCFVTTALFYPENQPNKGKKSSETGQNPRNRPKIGPKTPKKGSKTSKNGRKWVQGVGYHPGVGHQKRPKIGQNRPKNTEIRVKNTENDSKKGQNRPKTVPKHRKTAPK